MMDGKPVTDFEDTLERCLARLEAGEPLELVLQAAGEQAERLRPRLEAAAYLLQRRSAVAPTASRVTAGRRRLVSQLQQTRIQRQSGWVARWTGGWFSSMQLSARLLLALALAVCLLLGSSAAALAAQDALPGQALYAVKRGLEQAQLSLLLNPSRRAELHVELVERRLVELQDLALSGNSARIGATVDDLDQQVRRALETAQQLDTQDAAQAQRLQAGLYRTLIGQAPVLAALVMMSPGTARQAMDRAQLITERAIQATRPSPGAPSRYTPAAPPSTPQPANPSGLLEPHPGQG